MTTPQPIRVTVWSEFRHEKKNPKVAAIYPEGMGFIALHSAHYSKVFKSLMGTTCSLK